MSGHRADTRSPRFGRGYRTVGDMYARRPLVTPTISGRAASRRLVWPAAKSAMDPARYGQTGEFNGVRAGSVYGRPTPMYRQPDDFVRSTRIQAAHLPQSGTRLSLGSGSELPLPADTPARQTGQAAFTYLVVDILRRALAEVRTRQTSAADTACSEGIPVGISAATEVVAAIPMVITARATEPIGK